MTSYFARSRGITRIVICIVLIAFTASCTAFIPTGTTDPAELRTKVYTGEKVQITLHDRSRRVFIVERIDDDGIHGEGSSVAYDDMYRVHVHDHSVSESALLGLGVLVVVIIVALSSIDEDDIFEN